MSLGTHNCYKLGQAYLDQRLTPQPWGLGKMGAACHCGDYGSLRTDHFQAIPKYNLGYDDTHPQCLLIQPSGC